VYYGLTPDYELDSLVIDESVTQHAVTVTGLSPATVYHVKVGSADENGTNYSADHLVITSSHSSSTGQMNVYFSKSINTDLAANANEANGMIDLEQKLIERIQGAKFSIDLCFFSWNLEAVTDALIDAYYRRIRIRFIYDATHDQYQVYRLRELGIPIIDDSFGDNSASGKIQHNKFAIFDARNDSRFDDDWVWTGSLNLIKTGDGDIGVDAAQNVIEIQDQALAKAYTLEFNEMWGSDSNEPIAENSRFGVNKTDNVPHRFMINNKLVELYFCPSDNATAKIIDAIETANGSIYFSILAFTRVDVKLAMRDKFYNIPGFDIRGVFDSSSDSYSQYFSMNGEGNYAWNPPADVWLDGEPEVLHHKYMIIDSESPDSDPITITGSQNWSTSAETENDENTLIIHDASITNQYLQEFAERYHAAGGTGAFETTVETQSKSPQPAVFSLDQNYPNPFNMETQISFTIDNPGHTSLKIYDMNGRLVATLVDKYLAAQRYRLNFSPGKLASGVYVYKLRSNNRSLIKKLVLLK
jgi:phosphatidylserine/phosphatidylglycerophosphate/cardiolipin synthase-like enzyme